MIWMKKKKTALELFEAFLAETDLTIENSVYFPLNIRSGIIVRVIQDDGTTAYVFDEGDGYCGFMMGISFNPNGSYDNHEIYE